MIMTYHTFQKNSTVSSSGRYPLYSVCSFQNGMSNSGSPATATSSWAAVNSRRTYEAAAGAAAAAAVATAKLLSLAIYSTGNGISPPALERRRFQIQIDLQ